MNRKVFSIFFTFVFIVSGIGNFSLVKAADCKCQAIEILERFQEETTNIQITIKKESEKKSLIQRAVNKYVLELRDNGYEAYGIIPSNYEEMKAYFSSDFEKMNILPECAYIIIVNEELMDNNTPELYSASTSFSYTYNGATYIMRYLTVTAADNPSFGKVSTVNVCTSKVQTVIQNCLDTAINAYISSFSGVLGTVASICGLSVSNFSSTSTSSLNMNAASNWTRVFTQVYNSSYDQWVNGSCVEYVRYSSYMSGYYYKASTNAYTPVPQNTSSRTKYSSKYSDYEWRKRQAITYAASWTTYYDSVGSVSYYYGSRCVVTHNENF